MKDLIRTLPLLDSDLAMATGADFFDVEAWNEEITQGIFNPYTYWKLKEHLQDISATTLNILLSEYLPTYIGEALTMVKQDRGNASNLRDLIILKQIAADVYPRMANFLQEVILEEKYYIQVTAWYGENYNEEITIIADIREDIPDQIRRKMASKNIPFHVDFIIAGA